MAALGAVGDEWPTAITNVVRKVRTKMLGNLRSRLERAVAEGELRPATDIEHLSRFYLSVFEGMAIQARDGASRAELRRGGRGSHGGLAGRKRRRGQNNSVWRSPQHDTWSCPA